MTPTFATQEEADTWLVGQAKKPRRMVYVYYRPGHQPAEDAQLREQIDFVLHKSRDYCPYCTHFVGWNKLLQVYRMWVVYCPGHMRGTKKLSPKELDKWHTRIANREALMNKGVTKPDTIHREPLKSKFAQTQADIARLREIQNGQKFIRSENWDTKGILQRNTETGEYRWIEDHSVREAEVSVSYRTGFGTQADIQALIDYLKASKWAYSKGCIWAKGEDRAKATALVDILVAEKKKPPYTAYCGGTIPKGSHLPLCEEHRKDHEAQKTLERVHEVRGKPPPKKLSFDEMLEEMTNARPTEQPATKPVEVTGFPYTVTENPCYLCHGTGVRDGKRCGQCYGSGEQNRHGA